MDEEIDTESSRTCLKSHRMPAQDGSPHSVPKAQLALRNMEKGLRSKRRKMRYWPFTNTARPGFPSFPHSTPNSGWRMSQGHWRSSSPLHPLFNLELLASIPHSPQSLFKPWADPCIASASTPRAWSLCPRRVDPPGLWYLSDRSRGASLMRCSSTHSPCSCGPPAIHGSIFC